MKLMSLIVIMATLTGCATGQTSWTPEKRAQVMTRTYEYSYDHVFTTVVQRFKNKSVPIEYIDKENGIIRTGYVSLGQVLWGSGKANINVNLTKISETSTKVSANFHVEGYSDTIGIHMNDEMINEEQYSDFFESLSEELKS